MSPPAFQSAHQIEGGQDGTKNAAPAPKHSQEIRSAIASQFISRCLFVWLVRSVSTSINQHIFNKIALK